jgi:hypothetical protein
MLTKDEAVNLAASHAEAEFLCSEAVLMALAKCLGVESKLIPKIATGFGAGIGRQGEVCGALSGAVMGCPRFHGGWQEALLVCHRTHGGLP